MIGDSMDIAIVGAGAAGLFAAFHASEHSSNKVVIYEKNDIAGKKLRLTGNGRLNFSNEDLSMVHYEHSYGMVDPDFLHSLILEDDCKLIDSVIGEDGNVIFAQFLNSIGVRTTKIGELYYPFSERAGETTEMIISALERKGVEFVFGKDIREISNSDGKFIVDGKAYDRLILATGGKAYPKTGSDGGGYKLARAFGHTVSYTYPVLVGLTVLKEIGDALAGVRVKGTVSGYVDGELVSEAKGEIQFTENTISGICVYQLSRRLTKPIEEGKSVEISCDFLDDISLDELSDYIAKRNENLGDLPLGDYVRGILPDKLNYCILSRLSKDEEFASADFETKKRLYFAQIKAFRVTVMGHEGYDHAQCTRGGVALSEISDNMESKLCPGLFFAGEMVDVDGDCGGYNLQWAFSSGKVAGSSAGENA